MTNTIWCEPGLLHVNFGGDEAETSLLITRQDAAKYLECLFASPVVEMPIADAVKNAVRRRGVALRFTEELLVGKNAFVHQREPVVARVLDQVHSFDNGVECFFGLGVTIQAAQRHVKPVSCRDQPVGSARHLQAFTIRVERLVVLAGEIVSKPEVVPDIELERAGGNVARIGLPVGLDLVTLAFDQLRRFLQIANGEIKLPQRDVSMTAVSIKASVRRMERDAFRVRVDCFGETTEIGKTAPQPDDCIRVFGVGVVPRLGFS